FADNRQKLLGQKLSVLGACDCMNFVVKADPNLCEGIIARVVKKLMLSANINQNVGLLSWLAVFVHDGHLTMCRVQLVDGRPGPLFLASKIKHAHVPPPERL